MARAKETNKKVTGESLPSGITQQPSKEDFRLGEREQDLLKELFKWQERSENTHWVLGQPLGIQSA